MGAAGPLKDGNLRQRALQGSVYLAGRYGVSILLKFAGVLIITRQLGPAGYGSYVAAIAVYQYAMLFCQSGIGIYLIRSAEDPSAVSLATAYSCFLAMALAVILVLGGGLPLLERWIGIDGFGPVLAILLFATPFQLLTGPASALLERRFDYRGIAAVELGGQILFYPVAFALVWWGWGPVSLAVSFIVQQVTTFAATHWLARVSPRFGFDRGSAKAMMGYSAGFSAANWVWNFRSLINPMLVGPFLGAQAVGLVGMTIGLLDMLTVIKAIAWRLSIAVMAKIQHDVEKLRRAVNEGTELQTLALGSAVVGFGMVIQIVVPLVFGERWLPIVQLYPFIALGYFINSGFNMQASVLALLKRNGSVLAFNALHVLLFAGAAFWLVPRYGIAGYGYAELVGLGAYPLLYVLTKRAVGDLDYRCALPWWIGVAIGLFWRELGPWALAAPFLALSLPRSVKRIRELYATLRPGR